MAVYLDEPYTRYTPPVAAPPADSELVHDAHVFWGLAKRLGIQLTWLGVPLDMTTPPVIDDLLAIVAKRAGAPFDELQQAARGMLVGEPQYAEPAEPDWTGRFSLMPADVRAEVDGVLAQRQDDDFPYRLAVRRLRDVFNSVGRELASTRKRITYNRVHVNPDDLAALSIAPGDEVEVQSRHGSIVAVAHADPSLRTKVISIAHGFGGLPDEGHNRTDYWRDGVSPNLLLDGDKRESINAMPWMSGIQVCLRAHAPND
jgi:predicted molibdopterin-dependent oxidoreductase YjgC